MPRKIRAIQPAVSRADEAANRAEVTADSAKAVYVPTERGFRAGYVNYLAGEFVRQSKRRAAVAAGAADAQAGGAGTSPPNNMGEKVAPESEPEFITLVIDDRGNLLQVPKRHGHGDDAAFIDWINITIHKSTANQYLSAYRVFGSQSFVDDLTGLPGVRPTAITQEGDKVDDEVLVMALSMKLEQIFGFGVTSKTDHKLRNYYTSTYILGDDWGTVGIGGQEDTMLLMVSGTGLQAAKAGWEQRLYDFLSEQAVRPRITRCDLAYDDVEGKHYSVEQARDDHRNGFFMNGGRRPKYEGRGDWEYPDGTGRTVYIGTRASSRYARIYEKGMQLGHKWHPWLRVEVELKNDGCVIPFEVLLKAGAYLAGTYPALQWIADHKCERITGYRVQKEIDLNKSVEIVQHQFGCHIWMIWEMCGRDADKAMQLIMRTDKIPPRFKVADFNVSPEPMHAEYKQYMTWSELMSLNNPEITVPAFKAQSRISGNAAPF
ncbi:replication initiation factor domain-containing protein [Jeongeupia chitinilytica]|uniref:Replication initiation protein-like C-terminal domain-containing protein n=1 Tax=Jeongeupia chitinilytica TaxID=1041641 RepID=A0ABQ3GY46_9NEIS|nr:replication initiation factor domain-containing protein [Jeongeupia chitinilytica]GHD60798.1 hypothetical protein GCM10007350_14390 [Jeongeupia chitinilytica]